MKTTQTFAILPIVRKSKANKLGEAPIYMRITVNGEQVELSSRHYVDPSKWDSSSGRVRGKDEQAKSINDSLEALTYKAKKIYNQLIVSEQDISASVIKQQLIGKPVKQHTLLELFDQMVENIKVLVGNEYTVSTYKNYLASQKHIHSFVKTHFTPIKDVPIKELSYKFITDYELYLKTTGGCTQNGCIKHMQKLRKVITLAIHHEYLEKDPFMRYSIKKKKTVVQPLTKHELEQIESKDFSTERLNVIKDLFLFTCYTGLAFGDAAALTREHISLGIDNEEWIFISRKKTGSPCRIPLLSPAKIILEKYRDHPKVTSSGKLLPIPSNQKFNAYLKEVADFCGIHKRLTVHIGRHTFATVIALQNGIPMDVVKEILGHDSIVTTQMYAKVTDEKIAAATKDLRKNIK